MRILLDECLDVSLRHKLTVYDVKTVEYCGWKGIKNGKLLQLAASQFDVFVTIDKSIPNQQTLSRFDIAVIVLCPQTRSPDDIEKLFNELPPHP